LCGSWLFETLLGFHESLLFSYPLIPLGRSVSFTYFGAAPDPK